MKNFTRENDPRRNASGAMDTTPYKAISKIDRENRKRKQFMKTLFNFANLAGYRIKGNWYVEDRMTNEIVWTSKQNDNRKYWE